MKRTHTAALLALTIAFVGSLEFVPLPTTMDLDPEPPEVRFEPLWPGSSVGLNATNASVSVNAGIPILTYNILKLPNANTTGAWYVRFVHTSSSNINNLLTMRLGIDNGTAASDQIVALTRNLVQTEGTYVRLEPGTSSTIYVAASLQVPTKTSVLDFDIYVSDDGTDASRVLMKGQMTLT